MGWARITKGVWKLPVLDLSVYPRRRGQRAARVPQRVGARSMWYF